jgi:hypothetical protein
VTVWTEHVEPRHANDPAPPWVVVATRRTFARSLAAAVAVAAVVARLTVAVTTPAKVEARALAPYWLGIVGLVLLVRAAWMLAEPAGWAAAGVACLLVARGAAGGVSGR